MSQINQQSDENRSLEGGMFYPTGFIVAAFKTEELVQQAKLKLLAAGFSASDITVVSAADMQQQAAANLEKPALFAALGSTVKVRQEQHDLAADGCVFLLIHAAKDEQEQRAIAAMSGMPLSYAVKYRMLVIENLHATIKTGDSNDDLIKKHGT